MAYINEVTIKGFKSIIDQTISLGNINVFIGTNGAGKSNFLEAIAIIAASAEGGIDYKKLSNKGARLSSPEIFKSAFRNIERKKTFELRVKFGDYDYDMRINSKNDFSYFSEKLTFENNNLVSRSNRGARYNNRTINKLDSKASILSLIQSFDSEHRDAIQALKKFAIYSPSTPILRGVSEDNSFGEPLGLYGGRLAIALSEVMKENKKDHELQRFFKLMDWFQTVGVTTPTNSDIAPKQGLLGNLVVRYKDKFMSTNFNELYAYDVSEGALYILFVLVLLSHNKSPDIFALDNIDSTLNPGLIRQLMAHIIEILEEKTNKQLFLTTHNPTTLDAIDIFNDNHRLFVVSRADNGETKFERIQAPESITKKEWEKQYGGLKLSEIWLSGAIGGLPKSF